MTSKSEKDRAKQIQDRCQNILLQMLKDEDNKYCVDCDAKGPRWASWNLGIFLCIRCAGIHRNLGVHISKVKSVNLDSWTPEQVVSLQQMGNSRARAVYEANLPDSFRRPQNDSSLEAFIRAKYEQKKYIAKEWVPPAKPKVNWDKEIDEELEKQKRKKKTSSSSGVGPLPAPSASDKKYNKSDVIPSIPKPKSSVSPKLGRNTPPTAPEAKPNSAADLLGLDTTKTEAKPDDIFSSFFSAQEKPVEIKEAKPDLKTEEENFFKQPAPTEKEKSKLTKDSILALYSQTPSTYQAPATTFQQQTFHQNHVQTSQFNQSFNPQSQTSSGQFNQSFNPQSQTSTGQFNPQNQTSTGQFNPQNQTSTGQFNPQNQTSTGQFNPQSQTSTGQFNQSFNQFGSYQQQGFTQNQFSNQNGPFNQFQGNQYQFGMQQKPANLQQQNLPQQNLTQQNLPHQNLPQQTLPQQNLPQQNFFNQPQNVAQQFGSLSLGQSFPHSFAQNNVSNTWQ